MADSDEGGDQPHQATDSAAAVAKLSFKETANILQRSALTRSAYLAEGDINMLAMDSKSWVRCFEKAPFDGAIVVGSNTMRSPPNSDSLARLMELDADSNGKNPKIVLPGDMKCFDYYLWVRTTPNGRHVFVAEAKAVLTLEQAKGAQFLIMTSTKRSGFIALVPRPYFSLRQGKQYRTFGYPRVSRSIISSLRLPPETAPFNMPESMLETALDELKEYAEGQREHLRNPWTGHEYLKCKDNAWKPELQKLRTTALPPETTEVKLRKQLHEALQEANGDISAHQPDYAPLTSDVRIDHKSTNTSVFVEIKVGCFEEETMEDGAVRFKHLARTAGQLRGSAIFTFRAGWDWLLTVSAEGKEGFLINKDDIFGWSSFWHNDSSWLTHDFEANDDFLQKRKIILNSHITEVATKFTSIIKGFPEDSASDAAPLPATVTPQDIWKAYGPCPVPLFLATEPVREDMDAMEDEDNLGEELEALLQDEEEVESEGQDAADSEQEDADDDNDGVDTEMWRSKVQTSTTTGRQRIHAGRGGDNDRNGQLFNLIMDECYRCGSGCVVYLGSNCRMGPMAIVKHKWSTRDKETYAKKRMAPVWANALDDHTLMIPLLIQDAPWGRDYAPVEGPPLGVQNQRNAGPVLTFPLALPKEIAHLQKAMWIIPSEFMPKFHIGRHKITVRSPLFFKDQHAVDEFAVDMPDIHSTIFQFFGIHPVNIGLGKVQVDRKPYLRTVGEWRRMMDVWYDPMFEHQRVEPLLVGTDTEDD